MDYDTLKAQVVSVIKTNNNKEITGQVLQDVLSSIIEAAKQDQESISDESSARQSGDSALQTSINNEITRAQAAESEIESDLQNEIDDESSARQSADAALQKQINGSDNVSIARINTGDSGDLQYFLPSLITINTSDSGLAYTDGSTLGELDSVAASSYGLMSKLISVKRGQTIASSLSGVYIYEVPTGALSSGTYVRLLSKSNTWYATKNCYVSFLVYPTDGQETALAQSLLNSIYTITTPSLQTQIQNESAYRESGDSELRKLIAGSKTAYSYTSYQGMIAALNDAAAEDVELGQQVYIKASGKINSWIASINSTKVTYNYTDDATVEAALNSDAGLTVGYITLLPLADDGSVDLSDYYTKDEVDTKIAGLRSDINTNTGNISELQQAVNGDTVTANTTHSVYDTGLLDFVPADPSSDSSYLAGMSGGNMCGGISLNKGDIISTVERSDITIYRVYRDGDNQIAANCTIEKLGTGSYTATEDMEVLLYDTQGWGMQTTSSGGAFLTYIVQTTSTSLNARVEALEAGLTAEAVSDTAEYDDVTSVIS